MKKYFTLIILSLAIFSFTLMQDVNDVIASFKSGNASQVAKYFDNTVDITTPDKANSYSKSQAEAVLRDFFAGNTIKNFTVVHKGTNGGSEYVIGTLVTKTKNYRTTVFMKQKGDKQYLQEIRIENQ